MKAFVVLHPPLDNPFIVDPKLRLSSNSATRNSTFLNKTVLCSNIWVFPYSGIFTFSSFLGFAPEILFVPFMRMETISRVRGKNEAAIVYCGWALHQPKWGTKLHGRQDRSHRPRAPLYFIIEAFGQILQGVADLHPPKLVMDGGQKLQISLKIVTISYYAPLYSIHYFFFYRHHHLSLWSKCHLQEGSFFRGSFSSLLPPPFFPHLPSLWHATCHGHIYTHAHTCSLHFSPALSHIQHDKPERGCFISLCKSRTPGLSRFFFLLHMP